MVPQALQPRWIQGFFTAFQDVTDLFADLFPAEPAKDIGSHINYDLLAYSRMRGLMNTRTGPPQSAESYTMGTMDVEAETWREKIIIGSEVFSDEREPGQATGMNGQAEVERNTIALRNRFATFQNWLRAEALQGIKEYFPAGTASEMWELLLCSDTCIVDEVLYDWSTVPADEATARLTLMAIEADIRTARAALAAAGAQATDVYLNGVTMGYVEDNASMAGAGPLQEYVSRQVAESGMVTRWLGLNWHVVDNTYVQPIVGVTVPYIDDDVVIVVDSNNARAGRSMIECNPEDKDATAAGTRGIYFYEPYKSVEPPWIWTVAGEWTGQPIIALPCSEYVFQDVTNEGNGM